MFEGLTPLFLSHVHPDREEAAGMVAATMLRLDEAMAGTDHFVDTSETIRFLLALRQLGR